MAKKSDPNEIRLLNLGPTASWRTQAVYHATAEMMTVDSPDTIIICQPLTPYLCLGYHQIFDVILDRVECKRRDLPVVRRRVGGGSTYLDVNQLFYQCVFHHTRVPFRFKDVYAQMLAGPVATLRRLGLNANLRAINEVEVDGKRIAGIGGGRIGEACVVVGNLLFDFDYNAMAAVWNGPWPSFGELASSALRERIVTLWRVSGPISIEAVQWMLIDEFAKALGRPLVRGKPTQAETRYSREVADRLMSEQYLNLHSEDEEGPIEPMRALKIAAGVHIRADEVEHNGYHVCGSFRIDNHAIKEARLHSTPPRNWQKEEASLRGRPFKDWSHHL
jgi:lipoate-protein ligase A